MIILYFVTKVSRSGPSSHSCGPTYQNYVYQKKKKKKGRLIKIMEQTGKLWRKEDR